MGYILNIIIIFVVACIAGCIAFQYIDSINDVMLVGLNYEKLYKKIMENNYCSSMCTNFLSKIKYQTVSQKNMPWDENTNNYVMLHNFM